MTFSRSRQCSCRTQKSPRLSRVLVVVLCPRPFFGGPSESPAACFLPASFFHPDKPPRSSTENEGRRRGRLGEGSKGGGSFARIIGKRPRTKGDWGTGESRRATVCIEAINQAGQHCYDTGKHFFPGRTAIETKPLATDASRQAAHSNAEPRASSKNLAVDPVGGRIQTSREPGLHPGLLGRSSGSDKNVRSQDIWRGSKCGNRPSRDNRRKKDPSSGSGSNHGERGTLKRCGRANGRNVPLYLANSAIRG